MVQTKSLKFKTKNFDIHIKGNPEKCYARAIMPDDSAKEIADKKKYPFKLAEPIWFTFTYQEQNYELFFVKGWKWDGATIPPICWFFVGSNASPEFLFASMIHDRICNEKYLIKNNRYLSSLLFYEILLACKVNKTKAWLMFRAVENFQKTKGW